MPPSSKTSLHIGLACGGTGGHIFPGLATAEVLRARGHEITLWLSGKSVEAQAVSGWEGPRHTVAAKGFEGGIKGAPRTVWQLRRAYRQALNLMRQDVPDVILAMGSYASYGPVRAGVRLGVPVVLHEANLIPGRAIKHLSRFADVVGAGFEETRHYLQNAEIRVTGLPLRKDLADAAMGFNRTFGGDEPFRILAMGGSLGARAVNLIVRNAVAELYKRGAPNVFVTHLTGKNDEAEVREFYEQVGVPHHVSAFSTDMVEVYQNTDLAICRAGAATCAELAAFGVPALLIPYPFATKDHQTANAEALQRLNAADMVPEANLESAWLREYLEGCMHTPDRLQRLSANMMGAARTDASAQLADLVEEVARG